MPLGETLEVWRTRVTNERSTPARLSLFGAVEFCLWDANDDATNFQRNYSIGEVEVEDGVIYHKTEYRERRDHFAFFACSEPVAGFDTSRDAFLGPYRGWDRPLAVERGRDHRLDRPRLAADRRAPGRARAGAGRVARGHLRRSATPRTRATRSSTRRARRRSTSGASGRSSTATLAPGAAARAVDAAAGDVGRSCWAALQVVTGERARRPDGQHLERLPVHGDVQPVALGVAVRVRDRPRDGLPRLEPGPARVRAHGPRARPRSGSSTSPRPSCPTAAPTTSTSRSRSGATTPSAPASTTTRCGSCSRVAAYLKETGDRSILDEAVPYDNAAGQRGAAVRAPAAVHRLHAGPARAARPAAHRPRGLERLPQPQLLLGRARRVVPDDAEPRPAASRSRCSSPALFVLAARELAAIACAARRRRARRRAAVPAPTPMTAAIDDPRLGRRLVPARVRLRRQRRSARPTTTRARSSSSPRGCASMAGIGLEDGRARTALASVRERLATPHGIVLLQPAFTRYHVELGEITSYPPGYKENAGDLLPHQPVADDRRGDHGQRRRRARLLPADQPVGARGDLGRPSLRAVRLRPDDRRPRRADPRRGEELVAHRDRGLELRRDQPVDPGHPARSTTGCGSTRRCRRPGRDSGRHAGSGAPTYEIDVRRAGSQAGGTAPASVALLVDGMAIDGTVVPLAPAGTPAVRVKVVVS